MTAILTMKFHDDKENVEGFVIVSKEHATQNKHLSQDPSVKS